MLPTAIPENAHTKKKKKKSPMLDIGQKKEKQFMVEHYSVVLLAYRR